MIPHTSAMKPVMAPVSRGIHPKITIKIPPIMVAIPPTRTKIASKAFIAPATR
jgi:hypothetical protein